MLHGGLQDRDRHWATGLVAACRCFIWGSGVVRFFVFATLVLAIEAQRQAGAVAWQQAGVSFLGRTLCE